MKILNPNGETVSAADAVQATPAAAQGTSEMQSRSVEVNAENIGTFKKDGEMTDYEKAVVKSFQEASAEEAAQAQEAAEKARKEREAASSVDVGKHVEQDGLLKSVAGSSSKIDNTVKISEENKDSFCRALIANERYVERFSLFGGKMTCVIRSRTLEETDAIEAYLRYKIGTGELATPSDYSNLTRRALLAAQVQELNGVVYGELAAPMRVTNGPDGRKMPGWETQMDQWGEQSNAMAIALIRCVMEFEARYWAMVDNSKDTNFWSRGESTAE